MKKCGSKMGNKGFSLVELIVVIAIMAILLGIMAPQFLKYVEKSKVTADEQMLSALYAAIAYGIADPEVQLDTYSKAFIDGTMLSRTRLEDIPTDSKLYEEVISTIGWEDLTQATYKKYIKSAHTDNSTIYFMYKGTAQNPVAMWISETDFTGKKVLTENPATYLDIQKCVSIK